MSAVVVARGVSRDASVQVGIRAPRRKLTIPASPPGFLPRPRLDELVQQGLRRRLLLVTGPAGQGKTVATAAALRDHVAVAWLALDATDREPWRLCRLLLASLSETTGIDLECLGDDGDVHATLEAACARLDTVDVEVAVVLDDPARVLEHRANVRFINRLLDWMPSRLHLVVLAPRRPSIAIERRRARGEVADVGADELAFTEAEVADHLAAVCGAEVGPDVVQRVTQLAEGWPVAVQLLAARLAAGVTSQALLRADELTDASVADDLLREMLAGLAPSDRRFLLDTAVLDQLDAELVEHVTGQDHGAERLGRLEEVGLVVPVDPASGTFRHRRLLRPLLGAQLRTDTPGRDALLHTLAARCSAERGLWAAAVTHALDAGDDTAALDWLESRGSTLVRVDESAWLRGVLARFPVRTMQARPRLLATRTDLSLLVADRDDLERMLGDLEDPGCRDPEQRVALHRLQASLSRLRGDGVQAALAHRQGEAIDAITAHPLGVALAAEGRNDAASAALRVALADARAEAPIRELVVLGDLAWQRALAGHLVDADVLCRRAAELAAVLGRLAPPLPVLLARAQIALDRGRNDVARELGRVVRGSAMAGCDLALRADVGLFISRARWAHGDADGALLALADVDRDLYGHLPGAAVVGRLARARASIRLALDDVEGAIAALPGVASGADDLPPEDRLIAALVHLKRGQPERASQLVATLREDGIGPRLTVHALRVDASALAALGAVPQAERVRHQAERIGRTAGLPTPVGTRWSLASSSEPARLVRSPSVADEGFGHRAEGCPPDGITPRELAVLRRLSSATNAEIADELYVSVNTVKTHLKSVYRKLGVASREAAVCQARQSGLL
jgi:LuxR family transcriptional regulator, maltose regulon positive regulatory protein